MLGGMRRGVCVRAVDLKHSQHKRPASGDLACVRVWESATGSATMRTWSPVLNYLAPWGHAIDDQPGQGAGRVQNNYEMRAERADAKFDVRQKWTASAIWEVPVGQQRRWGSNWPRALDAFLCGWGINGIATVQGRPAVYGLPGSGHRPIPAEQRQAQRGFRGELEADVEPGGDKLRRDSRDDFSGTPESIRASRLVLAA